MKPLLKCVVAICLILTANAHPENIEEIKELPQSKEPIVEAEESEPQTRSERCTTCGVGLNIKSPKDVLAAIQALPGAEVHTQQSFEGCSSDKGCAGIKVKDGRVIERFGNVDAFKAAASSDLGNEFTFHAAGTLGDGPFWWNNPNSPFKNTGGAFEKFSQSSSSFASTGSGATGAGGASGLGGVGGLGGSGVGGSAAFGGGLDLSANPFLNGDFSKLAGGFAGAGQTGVKPGSAFQSSSFESSSFSSSNKGEVDISKNPFLNGGLNKFGQSGFAQGGAAATGFGAASQSSQGFGASAQGVQGFGTSGQGGQGSQGFGASTQSSQSSQGFGAGAQGAQGSQAFGAAAQGSQSSQGFGAGAQGAQGSQAFGAAAQGSQSSQGFGAGAQGTQGFGQSSFASQSSQSTFNSAGGSAGGKFGAPGYTGSSPRPFTASTVGSNVNLIQNTQKASEFEIEQQSQQNIDEIFQGTGNVVAPEHNGGDIQQTCAGQGYVCVHKAQCNNGVVNTNGAGVLQANTKKQYCNTRTEICCRIEVSSLAGAGGLQGSLGVGSATYSGSNQGSSIFASQAGQGQGGTFAQGTQGFGQAGSNFGQSSQSGFQASGQSSQSAFGQGQKSYGQSGTGFNQAGSFGQTQNSFGAQGAAGSNSFAAGSANRGTAGFGSNTAANNRFGSTNEVYKSTSQTNFVERDSFSSGSESSGIYRPGSIAAGLKPGIPYLPPDNTNVGTNIVSSTAFPTTPRPFTTPKPYVPPVSTSAPGYLPPEETQQSINRETQVPVPRPPNYNEGSLLLGPTRLPNRPPPGPVADIPAGCAAALKCTPIEYCTAEGVISNSTVILTRDQEAYRVPLTDCKDLESGRIGKCCRDPTYTDPWPTNQLGKWVPGVFGGDDGKYTPDSRGSPNNPRPQVTARPPPTTGNVVLNNFRPPKPTIPPFGPNQVTPGFPTATVSGQKNQFEVKGQGQYSQTGQGQYTQTGQGQYTQNGLGQVGIGGQGQVSQSGQGAAGQFGQGSSSFNQFSQSAQNTQTFGQKGKGQFGTQGQGFGVTQGQGVGVTQGQGFGVTQGLGVGVTQGQGFGVTQGQGFAASQGAGQVTTQSQGQFGQGSLVSQGQGQFNRQGQGQFAQGGQGQFGVGGAVEIDRQSQFSQVQKTQSFGQSGGQGQGGFGFQGQGGFGVRGQGGLQSQGQGFIRGQGQGQGINAGFGFQGVRGQFSQAVTQATEEQVSKGQGQAVIQGSGQEISQGIGTAIKQGQGFSVNQGSGLAVENEYSESVHRVFLQKYGADGQCGLLNGQKPYGNRNDLEVDFAEIPWQAMVLLQTNRSLLCGGVITRPDVVITSAACVDGLQAKNVLIKGGEWKLGIDEEPLPFQIVQVKTILRHPFYKRGSLLYDVAILVLSENLRFAKNIYPICLPRSGETLDAFYNGAGECIVTGWGKQVLQAHLLGSIMHSVNVSLINPGECQAKLSQDYPHLLENYDQESCACGQPTNPVNNICKVDIGSALACTTGDGHFTLRGVYSWDSGCQPGNQLAAFYKFDLEWYEWAIGLIESVRFAQFNSASSISRKQFSSQINSAIKGGRVSGGSSLGQGAKGGFGATKGGFGQLGGFGQAQVGSFGQGQRFGQFETSKFTETSSPISSNSFSATYTEKKVFQSEPKITTFTTKPEIVTFTTKPEIITYTTKPKIITYTTKPKIITYTTKPQIITYETSGSGTNPQYVAPGVTFNPNFQDAVGSHTHNAQCKCLENGKK